MTDSARPRLIALAVLASVATVTGVLMFSYPSTLGEARRGIALVHDVSGDLMIVASLAYLVAHLSRTWRMRRKLVSRWSGMGTAAIWAGSALTGVAGQVVGLEPGQSLNTAHIWSSLIALVLAMVHGAWGFFQPRGSGARSTP